MRVKADPPARGPDADPTDAPLDASGLAHRVKAIARAIGFDAVGICDVHPIERDALIDWLARGYGGTMTYLNRQAKRRQHPGRIAPGCRRVVVVLKNYFQDAPASRTPTARVARYAWGEDYHRVIGDQLGELAAGLIALGANADLTRAFVDAGPVPERELAQRAGLGWIAKNTMLISPDLGSFTFIGTVFTDLNLAIDQPLRTDHCGTCRLCLDACPTDAFAAARSLDARRCISYLTIEWRKAFDAEQGHNIGQWLFGCDMCQDVCPWNEKFTRASREPRFGPRADIVAAPLDQLVTLKDEDFAQRFGDTALARAGAAGIRRNARQVLANRKG